LLRAPWAVIMIQEVDVDIEVYVYMCIYVCISVYREYGEIIQEFDGLRDAPSAGLLPIHLEEKVRKFHSII
jgi:hypothetical protein